MGLIVGWGVSQKPMMGGRDVQTRNALALGGLGFEREWQDLPGPQKYVKQWPKSFNYSSKGYCFAYFWDPGVVYFELVLHEDSAAGCFKPSQGYSQSHSSINAENRAQTRFVRVLCQELPR